MLSKPSADSKMDQALGLCSGLTANDLKKSCTLRPMGWAKAQSKRSLFELQILALLAPFDSPTWLNGNLYQEDNMDMNLIPLVADLLKEGIPIMLYRSVGTTLNLPKLDFFCYPLFPNIFSTNN